MSAPVRESLLRILFQIEFSAVVSRHNGVFYAHAPQFNIWDIGDDIKSALSGMFDGLIGMLELTEERASIKDYLASRGFRVKQGIYRTSRDKRRSTIREYLDDLEWDRDDPDEGRRTVIPVRLARVEIVLAQEFSQPVQPLVWEPRYEETQVTQIAQAAR